jgi:Flp pilus assembly protein TadB
MGRWREAEEEVAISWVGSMAAYQRMTPEEAEREGFRRMQERIKESNTLSKTEKKALLNSNRKGFRKSMRQYAKEQKRSSADGLPKLLPKAALDLA